MKKLLAIISISLSIPLFVWGLVNFTYNINKKAQEIPRVNVDITGAPFQGPIVAPVTLIEFGDFQCPFCKMFHDQTLPSLLSNYNGKIKYVYKNFPLTAIHPQAQDLAEIAMCANDQDKFWEVSNLLYSDINNTNLQNTKDQIISSLGLDATTFNECVDSHKYTNIVNKDYSDAIGLGLYGTPTFFINGMRVDGAQPLANFQNIIDNELDLISQTPQETPTSNPTSTPKAIDDVYFPSTNTEIVFKTVNKNPNVSVASTDIDLGSTYTVEVNFKLQNKIKNGTFTSELPVQLLVNGIDLGVTNINLNTVSVKSLGANFKISGVYVAYEKPSSVRLIFDPQNLYKETDETNNDIIFNLDTKGEPNSCNGTCGSNYNCKADYFCYQGFCRNPICPSDKSCGCIGATNKPTSKPVNYYASIVPQPTNEPLISLSPSPTPYRDTRLITLKDPIYTPSPTMITEVIEPKTNYLTLIVTIASGIVIIWMFIVLIKNLKK